MPYQVRCTFISTDFDLEALLQLWCAAAAVVCTKLISNHKAILNMGVQQMQPSEENAHVPCSTCILLAVGLGQSDEDVALAHLAQQQQRHASRPASHKAAVPPTALAAGTSPFQHRASAAAAFSDDSSDSDDEILDLSMMDVDAVSGQVSRQPSEHAGRLSGRGAAWNQPPTRKASAGRLAVEPAATRMQPSLRW